MTRQHRINYDAVASNYDQRVPKMQLTGIVKALQNLAHQANARQVLDLGCGTGRSLQWLVDNLPSPPLCYGLDFSAGMLAQARHLNANYRLVRASAPQPPFTNSSFDLIMCVLAFHHFPDKPRVVQAAYRLLRPGGAFAIINVDPREPGHQWPIYTYFEGTYQADLQRFPTFATQEEMLRRAGFRQVSSPVIEVVDETIVGDDIFDNYWLRKDSSSQLILLSEQAYRAGLNRIRAAVEAAKAKGQTAVFKTHLVDRMCHGFKK